jgi:hypothetical protein
MINNNERTTIMRTCKECGCTPKNDEWAVNSNEHCMDCEQEQNDYYNACMENWNEIKATFNEENEISDEEQERANHIAKSMDRGEL